MLQKGGLKRYQFVSDFFVGYVLIDLSVFFLQGGETKWDWWGQASKAFKTEICINGSLPFCVGNNHKVFVNCLAPVQIFHAIPSSIFSTRMRRQWMKKAVWRLSGHGSSPWWRGEWSLKPSSFWLAGAKVACFLNPLAWAYTYSPPDSVGFPRSAIQGG